MGIFFLFILYSISSLSCKFWPQLAGKYASFTLLVYVRPYLTKWEDENPIVMDSWLGSINPQLHSLRTIYSNQGLIGLTCVKWRVFSKEELILGHIVLVPLKESPLFRNELNYTQVNVGAKVEPPTA